MFISKKKFNTLSDIKKHITLTPLIFVILFAALSALVVSLVLEYKQNNQIDLLIQKSQYDKKNLLKSYISDVKYNSSASFDDVEQTLNRSVYEINGHIEALLVNKKDITFDDIKAHIKSIEQKRGINFVVFDIKTFKVFYGDKLVSYVQTLANDNIQSEYFKIHMLRNIIYMGNENLMYWIDDERRNIRLSYFEKIDKKDWFIGAFSKVDDMKALTRKTIKNSLVSKSKAYENSYFWFYDYANGYVYNYYNKANKISAKKLQKDEKIEFQRFNQEKFDDVDDIYNFRKYQYLVSIKSFDISEKIRKIKNEYHTKLVIYVSIIVIAAIFMIFLSLAFAKFVNTLFNRYNKRLETKNSLYKKWKDRYELAIIASNDGLWDIDLKSKEIFFSNKWLEMFGYKRGEVQTFDEWLDLIHSDDRIQVEEDFKKHLEGKSEHFICEYRLRTKDNHYKWVLVRGKAFSQSSKETNRMLMMSMDIDYKKRLTQELENVELLVEMGKIVIFKWHNNKTLSVEEVSKSIESYGFEIDEFEEHFDYINIVHESDRQGLLDEIEKTIKNDKTFFTKIYRVYDKDKKARWVFNRTILLKDHFGKVTHLYGYINDITRMKMNEEELKLKVADEVEKNVQKDRLLAHQSKLASMGEVLGSIAHQWRQPLNNINLLIHFIRDNYGNFSKEQLNDSIYEAKVQIDYMSQTIDDFRNFYRPTKDKEEFELKKSIKACVKIVQSQLEKSSISLNIEGEDLLVHAYENELQQVIVNILNNASDAALVKLQKEQFKPQVLIKIIKEENSVKITLSNNCGEVEEDVLHRMFEPYFTTKFENQGTGIGLYMAKTIIEKNMHGKIEAQNIQDGIEFSIHLPI